MRFAVPALILILAPAWPSHAQTGSGLGVAINMVEMEREAWKKAATNLGIGPQSFVFETEESSEWMHPSYQIANGGPWQQITNDYLVSRWQKRCQTISMRYPGAVSMQDYAAYFPHKGWLAYQEYVATFRRIIQELRRQMGGVQ